VQAEDNPDQEIRLVIGCPARASEEERKALTDAVSGLVKYAMGRLWSRTGSTMH